MVKKKYKCPVCGYDKLEESPYDKYGQGSFEICPNCGIEFGYQDAVSDPKDLPERWAELRKKVTILNIDKFTDEEIFEELIQLSDESLNDLLYKYSVKIRKKNRYTDEEKLELAKKAVEEIDRYVLVKELGLEKRHSK